MANTNYSYAEVARCLGVERSYITNNIKRGKIIADVDKKEVDISLAENKLWLESQQAKGKVWDLNRSDPSSPKQPAAKKTKSQKNIGKNIDKNKSKKENEHVTRSRELQYQTQLQAFKQNELKIRQEEMKLGKQMGKLLPYDAVKSVFLFSIEQFRSTFLQNIDGITNIYVEILGADESKLKDISKKLIENVSDITKEAKDNILSGLARIVDEYQEVRGRGERK